MKRGVIAVFIVLLLLPAVVATMSIEGPTARTFNAGDQLSISGYVRESTPVTGFLEFSMECGDNTHLLQMLPASLSAGQQIMFPESLGLPNFVVSSSMEGTCRIRAELTSGNMLLDWAESDPFEVTKSLEATFDIEEPRIQIGSQLKITGEATRLDNTKIDGSAEIYFSRNDTRYLVTVIDIKEGALEYTHTMSALQEGRYFVDILVRDTFGNEKLFQDAASFVLIKELSVIAKLDSDQYLPGDTVTITGEAKTILQDPIKSASATISIGSKSYTTQITDGAFEGSFQLPHNIESGRQVVTVEVKDNAGNTGTTKVRLYIKAVPSSLSIRTSDDEFFPNSMIEVTATLYDQASEVMSGDISLEIIGPDGNIAGSKIIQSSKKEIFAFPEFSEPGEWTIKATYETLERKETVTLKEFLDLGVRLENAILKIKNLGNVEFNDKIEITATGEDDSYTVTKKETIPENGTALIDLSKQLPTGMYTLDITTPAGDHKFSNLNITDGKSWYSFNMAYLLLTLACIGLLSYTGYSRITPKKRSNAEPRPFKTRPARSAEPEKQKFSIYNIGKDKDKEMAEFKTRILRDVKIAEEAETRRMQRQNISRAMRSEEKPKEEKGIFSMFD